MDGIEIAINGIINNAELSNRAVEGDYIGDNGLLYCHKCNTPKQCRVTFFFGEKVVPCICKCKAAEMEESEQKRRRIEFINRIESYRWEAFNESHTRSMTFASADESNPALMKAMMKYVENFSEYLEAGKGLLLFGSVGTGKTFAAACVANALIDRGIPVMMTNFARIANTAQGLFEGRQAYFDGFNKFPLLIIDDLTAERKTDYMNEIVYNVIDSRSRSGLPLIITTNLTSNELQHPADITYQRLFSRLLGMCLPIEVKGKDRRKEQLRDDIQPMREKLGL